ncbi:MAG: aminotransferase [Pseudomonadota bacterium]
MNALNPNLLTAAASPIMEATGWLGETTIPAGRALLDLSQAAPGEPPHQSIREELARAMLEDPSAHRYGDVLGNAPLRAEVARQWSGIYGGEISPQQVGITAGCNQAFCVAIQTACRAGDSVMLPMPWYFNHKMWLDMAGIECLPLPCDAAMLPDLDEARRLMHAGVRAIALVTPNNPTGAEYPDALLHAFFDLAEEHGALLIVDETYRDFHSADGAPHTLFTRANWPEVLAHLYSFSKTYRIMGHRAGAMVTGSERIAQAEKFLDTVTICPSQAGQIAALQGLRALGNWVQIERAKFRDRCVLVRRLFGEVLPDWDLHGTGAYFAWATPPQGMASTEFARALLSEQSVLVLPGDMFLPEEHRPSRAVRIAFANADAAGLHEMVRRLAVFGG